MIYYHCYLNVGILDRVVNEFKNISKHVHKTIKSVERNFLRNLK